MAFLNKFIIFMQSENSTPALFGWQHLFFLGLLVILVVLIAVKCKNLSDKQFRTIMLTIGITLIILEILKQLNFSYDYEDGWEYNWKQFPFQFCSTPMYVILIVGCLKECKFRDYLCSFLATFGLFAGIVVMIYPSTVLSSIIFRFSQSMLHHIGMIMGAVVVIVSKKVKFEHTTMFKAIAVFSVVVTAAFLMNIIFHLSGNSSSFNMFYIGPYSDSDIPVLHQIGNLLNISADKLHVGNFIFLIIYIIGFSLCSYIILLIEIYINKILSSNKSLEYECSSN